MLLVLDVMTSFAIILICVFNAFLAAGFDYGAWKNIKRTEQKLGDTINSLETRIAQLERKHSSPDVVYVHRLNRPF